MILSTVIFLLLLIFVALVITVRLSVASSQMSSGSAIRRASAVEYHICPEIQLPMGHVKEALAAILHTILLGRSIGGQSCVEPITVSSDVIDVHYSKSDDPHVDKTVKTALQDFCRFLERRPERKASIVLSFFVPKHRTPITGGAAATAAAASSWTFNVIADFLSGVSDNREMFEQWTIPIHVVASSSHHPSQGMSREVKSAIRSGEAATGVVCSLSLVWLAAVVVMTLKYLIRLPRTPQRVIVALQVAGLRGQSWLNKFAIYPVSSEAFQLNYF